MIHIKSRNESPSSLYLSYMCKVKYWLIYTFTLQKDQDSVSAGADAAIEAALVAGE